MEDKSSLLAAKVQPTVAARKQETFRCQVETCSADLTDLKEYYLRYKIVSALCLTLKLHAFALMCHWLEVLMRLSLGLHNPIESIAYEQRFGLRFSCNCSARNVKSCGASFEMGSGRDFASCVEDFTALNCLMATSGVAGTP